ncbi:hypothetical protein, partial [Ferrimicrobium acidiphilum]
WSGSHRRRPANPVEPRVARRASFRGALLACPTLDFERIQPPCSDPVAVSKHGQVIGFYIPVEGDRKQARRAIERLGRSVEEILEETGMTEEELAQLFDLRRALPE